MAFAPSYSTGLARANPVTPVVTSRATRAPASVARAATGVYSLGVFSGTTGGAKIQCSGRCQKLRGPVVAAASSGAAPAGVPVKIQLTQHVKFGETLKLSGGAPELGEWDLARAPEFKWSEGDLWTLELELPAGKHEYKLVIHEPAEDVAWWELGKNRELSVEETVELTLEFNDPALLTEDDDELNAVSDAQLEADAEAPPSAEPETLAAADETPLEPVSDEAAPAEEESPAEPAPASPAASNGAGETAAPVAEAPKVEEPAPAVELPVETADSPPAAEAADSAVAEADKHAAVLPDPAAHNPAATQVSVVERRNVLLWQGVGLRVCMASPACAHIF
ncbi:hypothetical protein QBZ16_004512 [Prototheca wickerhamii]|uniref:CBM20 domain-containing protein n=1 Tax=Prototheca wickerhamii TaxID=3111 RepID=A0AAD9IHE6_PROWI|nr:hypothetical protein QBZ16_004512 [Prototheca wickerhamii]